MKKTLIMLLALSLLLSACGGAGEQEASAAAAANSDVILGDDRAAGSDWAGLGRVDNRAQAGATVAQMVAVLPDVISRSPAHVFILLGYSDLFVANRSVAAVVNELAGIIATLQAVNTTTVHVLAVPQVAKAIGSASYNAASMNALIKEYNSALKGRCQTMQVDYLDSNAALAYNGVLEDGYAAADGIHLNAGAYQTWSAMLAGVR